MNRVDANQREIFLMGKAQEAKIIFSMTGENLFERELVQFGGRSGEEAKGIIPSGQIANRLNEGIQKPAEQAMRPGILRVQVVCSLGHQPSCRIWSDFKNELL